MNNDNENKNNNVSDDDIERILSEFSGSKKSESEAEAPAPVKEPESVTKQNKKPKEKQKIVKDHKTKSGAVKHSLIVNKNKFSDFKKTKSFKKLLIAICAVIVAIIIVICIILGATANKRKLEKQYKIEIPKTVSSEYYEAYAKNTELIGHLTVDNSNIDYNVYQTKDNEFYKFHSDTRASSTEGTLYLDKKDKSTSQITTIYGSKALLGEMEEMYSNIEEYKSHPIIKYGDLKEKNNWVVVGAFYTNSDKKYDNNYAFPYSTPDMTEDSLIDLRDSLNARFMYRTEREIKIEDKFLMISVDSNLFPSAKFVVVAVKSNEKVDVDKAKENKKICYPQIWYDQNGKENPYKISGKWYPTVYTSDSKEVTSKLSQIDYQ